MAALTGERTPRAWRIAAALATALVGAFTLLSSLTRDLAGREQVLSAIVPGPAQAVAHLAGIAGGVTLVLLARGILAGRRGAIHAAPVVLCVLAGVHVAKGLDYEEALVALGLAALLALGLRAMRAGARPPRVLLAGLVAAGAASAAYAVALSQELVRRGGSDLDQAVAGAWSLTWRAAGGATTAAAGSTGTLVHVLLASAVLALLAGVRAILAPVPAQDGHDAQEHRRAAEIVRAHGRCSIAPFALRADKAFFFADGGVLAYRTVRDTAVVSGDPVGPPGTEPAIVAAFLRHAHRRGWDVAIMAAGSEHLAAYRELGLHVLRIGSEAVATPGAMTLDGGTHKTLRKAVNRVHRRGWTVDVVPAAELRADQVRELAAIDAAWRRGQPRLTGFSMAMDRLWGAEEDAHDLYVLGRAPDGTLHGFLRFIPYASGLSLDAMRRTGDEPNGFNEALILAAMRHADEGGLAEVSLNFAGFEHVMGSGAVLDRRGRIVRAALRLAHGRFQLERLARFNARFDPAWRPRHLVYESYVRLPRTALRVLQAEAYVRAPSHRWREDAWLPAERPWATVTTATTGGAR